VTPTLSGSGDALSSLPARAALVQADLRHFATLPGGGALAGSFTANGTTTTWVPLIDTSGSTIGLVNAAATGSPPATTYTYDPSGTPTVGGTTNDWPFLYHGIEQEFVDAPYYYSGGGQFYSPQLVRSLSETSATSTSGSNSGPAGNAIARPSGSGGVPTAVGDAGIAAAASSASNLALTGILAVLEPKIFAAAWAAGAIPGIIVTAAFGLFDIFDAIFGGGDSAPPTPRQLLHGRHPLYPVILAVPPGLIPNQESSGKPELCGDPCICPIKPLADDRVLEIPQATTPATPTPRPTPTWDQIEQDIARLRANGEDAADIERYLEDVDGLPKSLAYPLSLPGAYVPHPYQAIPTPGPGPILPE
jgi:hypothetical protein